MSFKFINILLSVIAIIISFYSILDKNKKAKNDRKYNIFSENYIDVLLWEIPKYYSRIYISNDKVEGIDEFIESLSKLKKNLIVIQIINKKTYDDWIYKIESLETFIVNQGNLSIKSQYDRNIFYNQLRQKVKIIYSTILKEDYKNILK